MPAIKPRGYNDPAKKLKAKKAAEFELKQLERKRDATYHRTLTSTVEGQGVMFDLTNKFPHWRPRFGPDVAEVKHQDPLINAAIIEGEQNVIRWIEERISAAEARRQAMVAAQTTPTQKT